MSCQAARETERQVVEVNMRLGRQAGHTRPPNGRSPFVPAWRLEMAVSMAKWERLARNRAIPPHLARALMPTATFRPRLYPSLDGDDLLEEKLAMSRKAGAKRCRNVSQDAGAGTWGDLRWP